MEWFCPCQLYAVEKIVQENRLQYFGLQLQDGKSIWNRQNEL